jgi:hypothetical protein
MEPDDLLCSRNARPQKGGVGSHQTILLARRTRTMKRCSSDARSEGQSGDSLVGQTVRAGVCREDPQYVYFTVSLS